jgi:uncharacterized membrane protein YeaQ/YmgE (transglycosylase-associated protein family)
MNLENECANKRSERLFGIIFSLITGFVGAFFAFVFIWFLKKVVTNHTMDGSVVVFLSILFLIVYFFSKLTYRLAFNKCTYLLSTPELRITGWFFILFPPCASVMYLINGQVADLVKYLAPTLPGLFYGYIALKVAKKRGTASNHGMVADATNNVAPHTP